MQRALLVGLNESLDELRELSRAAGAEVVGEERQSRRSPDPAWFVGKGKASRLRDEVIRLEADLVIFDDELTPAQTRNLEKLLDIPVVDRTGLILDIFSRRARTREGKLQVELAQLTYLASRLKGRAEWLSRPGGGIGTRGPGETQLEVDRRRIRTRMARLRKEIEEVRRHRLLHRTRRRRNRFPTVSLVGYTNAGKSTLFRRLSGEDTLVSGQVFSTLDTIVRRVRLDPELTILLADTVGFVRRLPPELVAAFRATLEEVAESDLILRVVDVSDLYWEEKASVVDEVLGDLGCEGHASLRVLNKTDLAGEVSGASGIPVSARDGTGIPALRARIREALAPAPGSGDPGRGFAFVSKG
jgi:GTP-binding protein HflX